MKDAVIGVLIMLVLVFMFLSISISNERNKCLAKIGFPLCVSNLEDGEIYHRVDSVDDWRIFMLNKGDGSQVYYLNYKELPKVFIPKKIGKEYKMIPVPEDALATKE